MRKPEVATLMMLPVERDGKGALVDQVTDLRPLTDLILPDEPRKTIDRVLAEFRRAGQLFARGLRPANRILFRGPPGCGKTAASGGVALALGIPMVTARIDAIIGQFMGTTAAHLRRVFDYAREFRVVLFLDEFDAIGRARINADHDSGEIKRALSSALTMIEEFASNPHSSVLIAATNHDGMLDPAMFRRFDKIVTFPHPTPPQAVELLKRLVDRYDTRTITKASPPAWSSWPRKLAGMSFADVERVALDAVKSTVIDESLSIEDALRAALAEHQGRRPATTGRAKR
jgi:SpoVK/Ycf46/Vps4 family AAA+-type ATPase